MNCKNSKYFQAFLENGGLYAIFITTDGSKPMKYSYTVSSLFIVHFKRDCYER